MSITIIRIKGIHAERTEALRTARRPAWITPAEVMLSAIVIPAIVYLGAYFGA